jgi:Zn ribbon nucleic-acid-binding protein
MEPEEVVWETKVWTCPACHQQQRLRYRNGKDVGSSCSYCGYKPGKYRRFYVKDVQKGKRIQVETLRKPLSPYR